MLDSHILTLHMSSGFILSIFIMTCEIKIEVSHLSPNELYLTLDSLIPQKLHNTLLSAIVYKSI